MSERPDPLERALARLAAPPPPRDLAERCFVTIPVGPTTERNEEEAMPYILAVEDEPNILRLVQVTLEKQGYRVQTAKNGAEAWKKIRDNRPILVVSDVMMPEMDGFTLLSTIRRDPEFADLPVIMLTAKAQNENVIEGYSRGTDLYLTKPFNPQELIQFVGRILAATEPSEPGVFRIG